MYARLRQMFSLAVLAAALCGSSAQAQTPTPTPAPEAKPDYTITGNFGFYSQYVFRGLTQTDRKPAAPGRLRLRAHQRLLPRHLGLEHQLAA